MWQASLNCGSSEFATLHIIASTFTESFPLFQQQFTQLPGSRQHFSEKKEFYFKLNIVGLLIENYKLYLYFLL